MATAISVLIHQVQTFSCRIATAPQYLGRSFRESQDRQPDSSPEESSVPRLYQKPSRQQNITSEASTYRRQAEIYRRYFSARSIDPRFHPTSNVVPRAPHPLPAIPFSSFPHHSPSLLLRALSPYLPIAPRKTIYSCHLPTPRPTIRTLEITWLGRRNNQSRFESLNQPGKAEGAF